MSYQPLMSTTPHRIPSAGLLLLAGLVCTLGACQSDPNDVSFDGIRKNLTPELQSQAERPSDIDRNLAVTFDTNGRMIWNDLGRAFYTDRPSMLSPFPFAPTGGQPR